MTDRRGLGRGKGIGYFNIVPKDPYIHSLSAKGVKSKKPKKSKTPNLDKMPERTDMFSALRGKAFRKDFGWIPTPQKKGLIRELARKVVDGAEWAIEWEKQHLPSQKAWVKKEFDKAKEMALKLEEKGAEKLKQWKEEMQKKKDLDDVRDELDINDDGVQDIPMTELEKANSKIVSNLNKIDLDKNGVPDHVEEGFTELTNLPTTMETPLPSYLDYGENVMSNQPSFTLPIPTMTGEPPEPEPTPEPEGVIPLEVYDVETKPETKMGVPFPFMTGEEPKPKKEGFFQKAGVVAQKVGKSGVEFAKKEIAEGKKYIATKKEETRQLHAIPDAQLKQLAIQEGASAFGLNKYEREIIRREKEKLYLEKKVKEIREGKTDTTGGLGDMFGFINPIATLKPKPQTATEDGTNEQIGNALSFLNPLTAFKPPQERAVYKRIQKGRVKQQPTYQKPLDLGINLDFANPFSVFKLSAKGMDNEKLKVALRTRPEFFDKVGHFMNQGMSEKSAVKKAEDYYIKVIKNG